VISTNVAVLADDTNSGKAVEGSVATSPVVLRWLCDSP